MAKTNPQTLSEIQCKAMLKAIADALYVIDGKWKLRIVVALKEGNKRFNELQRVLTGISAKVLSAELKDLEINGFVQRNIHGDTPSNVEYELAAYAETLDPVLFSLSNWGERHKEKVMQHSKTEKNGAAV